LLAEFDRRRRVILLFSVYRIKIKTAIWFEIAVNF
jgi:hypothetical protein